MKTPQQIKNEVEKEEIANKITDEILEDFRTIFPRVKNNKTLNYLINDKKLGQLRYFIDKAIKRNLQ